MIFDWIRNRRRKQILESPMPEAWTETLTRNVACYRSLNGDEQQRLRQLVQVFVAEKHWEGAGGLELDDEIRVTVAGQACMLILGLAHDLYRRVESIVIYPSTVLTAVRRPGIFSPTGQLPEQPMPILGQAFVRGPVILVWDAARSGGRDPRDGKNVVYHEFAHKLDMLDGHADGVPPLADDETYARWIEVMSEAYGRLQRNADAGRRTMLDQYALTNGAEFFAVATEHFFEQGRTLQRKYPDVYAVLRDFYQQDPAVRGRG